MSIRAEVRGLGPEGLTDSKTVSRTGTGEGNGSQVRSGKERVVCREMESLKGLRKGPSDPWNSANLTPVWAGSWAGGDGGLCRRLMSVWARTGQRERRRGAESEGCCAGRSNRD